MSKRVEILDLGTVPYVQGLQIQNRISRERQEGTRPDTLLFLQHPSTYTRGRRASDDELPRDYSWYAERGIEVHEADRGGQVTWHGPGQLVVYPIVDLSAYRDDVHLFVRRLESTMVGTLGDLGIEAGTIPGMTGVWTGIPELLGADSGDPAVEAAVAEGHLRKIGSIGIHVRRGITTHGFAVNVDCNLEPFSWIIPCGIERCTVTSVLEESGSSPGLPVVSEIVSRRYSKEMDRTPIAGSASELMVELAGEAVAG